MVPRGAIVAIGTCEKGRSNAESCGEHGGTTKVINPACHGKIIVLLLLLFLGQTMQVAPLPACKDQILWNLWYSGTQKHQIFIVHKSRIQMEARSEHVLPPLLYYKYLFDRFQTLLHLTSSHTLCSLKGHVAQPDPKLSWVKWNEKGPKKEKAPTNASYLVSQDTTCS